MKFTYAFLLFYNYVAPARCFHLEVIYSMTINFENKFCIFQPAFGCCAPQTQVEIVMFSICYAKKLKKHQKETNLLQNLAKNGFLKFAPKRWLIFYFQL